MQVVWDGRSRAGRWRQEGMLVLVARALCELHVIVLKQVFDRERFSGP